MAHAYLDLVDFLLVAEAITGTPAETLARMETLVQRAQSALAAPAASFSDTELYPDPVAKAAILCSRIVRNHPLVDGNKRVAYLCLVESLERNGYGWPYPTGPEDENDIVGTIVNLAAGVLEEKDFIEWVRQRTRSSRRDSPCSSPQ